MLTKKKQKNIIETGLTGTMSAMLISGLTGNKRTHVAMGTAFVGLAVFHYLTHLPSLRKRRRRRKRIRPVNRELRWKNGLKG